MFYSSTKTVAVIGSKTLGCYLLYDHETYKLSNEGCKQKINCLVCSCYCGGQKILTCFKICCNKYWQEYFCLHKNSQARVQQVPFTLFLNCRYYVRATLLFVIEHTLVLPFLARNFLDTISFFSRLEIFCVMESQSIATAPTWRTRSDSWSLTCRAWVAVSVSSYATASIAIRITGILEPPGRRTHLPKWRYLPLMSYWYDTMERMEVPPYSTRH